MSKPKKRTAYALMGLAVILTVGLVFSLVLVSRVDRGPDFVAALKQGTVDASDIKSVEVLAPAIGSAPFTKSEVDALVRKHLIDVPDVISALTELLATGVSGGQFQNHPVNTYHAYWRINLRGGGFYLLYVEVY